MVDYKVFFLKKSCACYSFLLKKYLHCFMYAVLSCMPWQVKCLFPVPRGATRLPELLGKPSKIHFHPRKLPTQISWDVDDGRLAAQRQKAPPRDGTCRRAAPPVSNQGSSLSAPAVAPAKVTSSVIVNAERGFCLSEPEEAGNAVPQEWNLLTEFITSLKWHVQQGLEDLFPF